ncbi:uncharacterized protein EI97DRAFT_432080 [Westerdykella ornata]|uniref:Zinc/iron permease n=1 Tax=Westerdykella ornata TaxID=318751 RepID=A0A6A6JNA2_WESOR|nr:uncharacterized protein EI97DRAFT_432080 [Westerdykella ornata]KAF2277992.1 hypothetical protein EI97DRAFT_432080 [Westerdykella ornata]
MERLGMGNDERGWILAIISGIACVAGASVIYIDILIRQFPGKKNWKLEDSNLFLSSGFSLSFGVLIFSALYKILPSSRRYLEDGGLPPRVAVFTLVACFLLGAFAISILSRILHHYIPHSVVDCAHDHGDEETGKLGDEEHGVSVATDAHTPRDGRPVELVASQTRVYGNPKAAQSELLRRPSLHASISTKVSHLVSGSKEFCDENGRCYGYSDPCGQDCFRNVQARIPRRNSVPGDKPLTRPSGLKKLVTAHERQPLLENIEEDHVLSPSIPAVSGHSTMESSTELPTQDINGHPQPFTYGTLQKHASDPFVTRAQSSSSSSSLPSHPVHSHNNNNTPHHQHHHQHHHHVPTNAFLSIGLQTSCAIALHKIPEGFITYATNHANPTLGAAIFLALFIHNITEGFAMALPLYLAIHSRWRAMFWSALLGGVSQPLGAGVAALWFHFAPSSPSVGDPKDGGDKDYERMRRHEDLAYGCMFAATAGVMAMVGLQLFGESLELTHSRRVCFLSAFVGMGILGLSSALTA